MAIKTLLIEDDPAIGYLIANRLDYMGLEYTHATNGMDAMDYLDTTQPDLILLDLNIPMPDGWAVLDYAKELYGNGSFHVIVTSARRDVISRARADIEQVDFFLHKPFTAYDLMETITSVLGLIEEDAETDVDDAPMAEETAVEVVAEDDVDEVVEPVTE